MDERSAAQSAPAGAKTPWYKHVWALIGGIGVVLGIVTGVLALLDRDDGLPEFTGDVSESSDLSQFLKFAEDHDGDEVELDLSCTVDEADLCRTFGAPPFASAGEAIWLYPEGFCGAEQLYDCEGSTVFVITTDGSDLFMGNADGAGTFGVKGQAIVNRMDGANAPSGVDPWAIRGVTVD